MMSLLSSMDSLVVLLLLSWSTLQLLSTNGNTHRSFGAPALNRTSRTSARRLRAVNGLKPINCRLESWTPWTPCDSCTDHKLRFRKLEQASQFGGTACFESLWETLACPATSAPCLMPDYCGRSVTCKETGQFSIWCCVAMATLETFSSANQHDFHGVGRCISPSLRCNGEADCDDLSDEDDCEVLNLRKDKCSTLFSVPGAERGTQGYNALTGEFVDQVLDPKYFGGKCDYVYNGDWRKFTYDAFCENLHYNEDEKNYRQPYNYHTYQFVAEATSEGSKEYYSDALDLLSARRTISSSHRAGTVGIYYVEVGVGGSKESHFLRNLTQHKSQDLGFIRLVSSVETAHFKMRSEKLELHEDFYLSLMALPDQYHFGAYSRFFDTFGTHYVTQGVMGGTLEYVVVVNKTSMAESKLEEKQVGSCLGASLGLNYPLQGYGTASLSVGGDLCKKHGTLHQDSDTGSAVIEDIITMVTGGYTDTSSSLLTIRDPETYRKWGASLKYNPAVIKYETMPLHELVRFSTASDHVGARLANLQRGLDEYQQQFSSCRCAPCRNNGVPVLTATSCSCICKAGYQGIACQDTLRPDTSTDGSWSCWGTWSPCTSGSKRRTRVCNNPPPDGGGATCLGSSSQTQRC
ncbi:complement component C8 alpha chain-like [Nerophis ophidion]|uniref:complement component C8 alpha chain-like n=1 Tax=Nerophis ophidion TaxID=159077 RepID=UPI002AE08CD7|nr:complement component C8 alpha chain-like [Nerophis ophidion]